MDRRVHLGDMLNAVGQHLADIIGGHPDGTYLYVEADDGSCDAGIFYDDGDTVVYHDPSQELFDELIAIWDFAETHEKWAVMHYDVNNGKFDTRFEFSEQLDENEDITDRRGRALLERYGDRPVIYPPPTANMRTLTLDDFPADEDE